MASVTDNASELDELLRSHVQIRQEILKCLERHEQQTAGMRKRLAPWAQTIDRIKKEKAQPTQRIASPVTYAARPRGSGYSQWTTPAMEREAEGRKQKAAQQELEAERRRAVELLKRLPELEQQQRADRRAEEARTRKVEMRKERASGGPTASKWLWWRSPAKKAEEQLPPPYSAIDGSQDRTTEKLER